MILNKKSGPNTLITTNFTLAKRRTLKESVSIVMEYLLLLIPYVFRPLIKMATALDLTFILPRIIK